MTLRALVNERSGRATVSGPCDAFRKANQRFAKALTREKIPHHFTIPPGPHNQPVLRDGGTIEMLLWHDHLPREG